MLLNCGVGDDSWDSFGQQGDWNSQSYRKSTLNIHQKDWYWIWSSNTLATWCEELTHWKRLWCWERLKAGGEEDERGWDSWMESPTYWAWVWANSGIWWRTGKAGMLKSMGSQRVRHKWPSEQQHHMRRCSNSLLKGTYFHHQGIGLKWIILLNVLILGS